MLSFPAATSAHYERPATFPAGTGAARNDFELAAQEDTSSLNRYLGNHMGSDALGHSLPNGLDFYWDGQGKGSCWQADHPSGAVPMAVPGCAGGGGVMRLVADPNALVLFATCIGADMPTGTFPAGCDWFDTPPRPGSSGVSITIEGVAPSIQLVAVLLFFGWLVRRSGGLTLMSIGIWQPRSSAHCS